MNARYCTFSSEQTESLKRNLHSSIFWLLLYKEREDETLEKYFDFLLFKIGGLNSLIGQPPIMVELLTLLESARIELDKGNDFNWNLYRKAVLDAESVVDRLV